MTTYGKCFCGLCKEWTEENVWDHGLSCFVCDECVDHAIAAYHAMRDSMKPKSIPQLLYIYGNYHNPRKIHSDPL